MKLIVWKHVVTLEVGQSYILSDISVRTFNDEKYVTTTKYSSIKAIPPITTNFTDTDTDIYRHSPQGFSVSVYNVSVGDFTDCI